MHFALKQLTKNDPAETVRRAADEAAKLIEPTVDGCPSDGAQRFLRPREARLTLIAHSAAPPAEARAVISTAPGAGRSTATARW